MIDRGFQDQFYASTLILHAKSIVDSSEYYIPYINLIIESQSIEKIPSSVKFLLSSRANAILKSITLFYKLKCFLQFLQGKFLGWPDVNWTDPIIQYDCFFHLNNFGFKSLLDYTHEIYFIQIDRSEIEKILEKCFQWAIHQFPKFPALDDSIKIEETGKWNSSHCQHIFENHK